MLKLSNVHVANMHDMTWNNVIDFFILAWQDTEPRSLAPSYGVATPGL